MHRSRVVDGVRAACAIAAALFMGAALAQGFPARPVKLVVPFPAGGPTDAIARLAAEGLAAPLGQPVVVENRGGAGGAIAAEFVARSPADGHTLLVAGQGILFINKSLNAKLAYNPDADFTFIGMIGMFPNVVVSHPDAVPVKTMQELVQLARAKPGTLSYGSNGVGSLSHLTTEVIAKTAEVKFLHVPYQGAAPQMSDLLAGRIGLSIIATQSVVPLIRQGKLRALAVSTNRRYAGLPDVPTLIEAGFPTLDAPVWFGIVAPRETPPAALAQLRSVLAAVIAAPSYGAELAKREALPFALSPAEAEALLTRERKLWDDAVKATGAAEASASK
jgi:tripartite-type tricarboxylate transporter receptor subunit TctC